MKKIKTGVSEELTKAQKQFDAVPWGKKLSIGELVPEGERLSEKRCQDILREYVEKHHPTFKKLEATYHSLSSFLKKKAEARCGHSTEGNHRRSIEGGCRRAVVKTDQGDLRTSLLVGASAGHRRSDQTRGA